jgi:hypothetical protein
VAFHGCQFLLQQPWEAMLRQMLRHRNTLHRPSCLCHAPMGKMILPSANLWLPNDDIIVVCLSVVDTWCLSSAHPRNSAPPPPPPLPRPGSRHRMRKATRPTAAVTALTQMSPPRPSLMARRRASSLKIGMTCRLLLST